MTAIGKRHVAALDGLRGVAVLLVMACHFSQTIPETTWLGAIVARSFYEGWVGVDVFFVLSGYLITSGLVMPSELDVPARMRRFYVRRTLRIFPLYYAVLAVGSIVCLTVGLKPPGLTYWLYVDNLPVVGDHDATSWTGHLWSLAIEEQFYLVWPAFMLLVPRRRAHVTLLLLVLVVAARFAILFSSDLRFTDATAFVYRVTFTRADGLLAGALLAIVESDPESRAARIWNRVRVPGLFLLLSLFLVPRLLSATGEDTLARMAWSFEPLALAYAFAVVVSAAVEGTYAPRLTRFLSKPWLMACGRVSYAMYLFHWPLAAAARPLVKHMNAVVSAWTSTLLHLALMPAAAVAVFLLARLSYRYFESPFLALKSRFAD